MRSSPEPEFVFVLAEAELETVPKEIQSDKRILANANTRGKKASNILLDASYHHSAMKGLREGDRRGRPDIAHLFLMLCLDSRLNRAGRLKTIVHTRNDERISVSPKTRLPPSYHRFVGLMESLFQNGAVPSMQEPLMTIEKDWALLDVLSAEKCSSVITLEVEGNEASPIHALTSEPAKSIAVVIGGFPSGSLHSDLSSLSPLKLSLGKEMLRVWTVTAEMLSWAYASITVP